MTAEKPLFVRLPAAEAEKLDNASHTLRMAKKDLVTALAGGLALGAALLALLYGWRRSRRAIAPEDAEPTPPPAGR